MAGVTELARAKWVSKLVATDSVIRSMLLDAAPEKVDAVFRSTEIKQLLSQLLKLSAVKQPASSAKKVTRGRRQKKKVSSSSSTKKKPKRKKLRQRKKKKSPSSISGTSTNTLDDAVAAAQAVSPQHVMTVGMPFMSSDDEILDDDRDLDKTVYWNELNHPFSGNAPNVFSDSGSAGGGNSSNSRTSSNGTPISANSGSGCGISDQESSPQGSESPRGRRVSFAEDVWVQEIPKVDKSLIKDLFYSEADIDDMYQEAEDEVLNATVPLTASGGGSGGELGSEKGGGGFNSTI